MSTAVITKSSGMFSISCCVEVNIRSTPDRLWALLTNVKDIPRWNSTVASIEGEIREGGRLRLRVPDSKQVFTPTVSGVVEKERMVWTGGFAPMFKGVRKYALTPRAEGTTDFVMEERFAGLMLPLIKGSLPDFGPIFERFAMDLKKAAEANPAMADG